MNRSSSAPETTPVQAPNFSVNYELEHIYTTAFPAHEVELTFQYISPINLTLAVYIMIQNTMVIYNYHKDWKRISSLLFILIAIVDIGSACSALGINSVFLLCLLDESLQLPKWTYSTCFYLGLACYASSTFFGVVLTVVKTVNIMNPFYRLKEFPLKVVLLVIPLMNIALFMSDTWVWNDMVPDDLYNDHPKCANWGGLWFLIDYSLGDTSAHYILFVVLSNRPDWVQIVVELAPLVVQFCLPGLIVFVCMILQMVYIKKAFRGSENPLLNNANQINLTVFLISLLYLSSVAVFGFPPLVVYLKDINSEFGLTTIKHLNYYYDDIPYVLVTIGKFTLPLLNAALFPTILILRKPDLRAKYRDYILAVCCLPLTVFRKVCHQVQRRRGYTEI